ncbi:hypothetical protein BJX62DRAFT_221272 [Aspergillus germanicus]
MKPEYYNNKVRLHKFPHWASDVQIQQVLESKGVDSKHGVIDTGPFLGLWRTQGARAWVPAHQLREPELRPEVRTGSAGLLGLGGSLWLRGYGCVYAWLGLYWAR